MSDHYSVPLKKTDGILKSDPLNKQNKTKQCKKTDINSLSNCWMQQLVMLNYFLSSSETLLLQTELIQQWEQISHINGRKNLQQKKN